MEIYEKLNLKLYHNSPIEKLTIIPIEYHIIILFTMKT